MGKKFMKILSCLLILCVMMAAVGCQEAVREVLENAVDESEGSLTEAQVDKLAFGAVLSTRNSMHYRTMFGMSSIYQETMEEIMEESWDVYDRRTALETLDWLRDEGHRLPYSDEYYGYDEIYLIITGRQEPVEDELEMFSAELSGYEAICEGLIADFGYTQAELDSITTISAWDYDRLVTVARWCAGLGYITEDEAWTYIDEAISLARSDYDNWRTYFAGVLFGRTIWAEDGRFDRDDKDIANKLLLEDDSIYSTAPFALQERV